MRQLTIIFRFVCLWLGFSVALIANAQEPAEEEYLLKVGFIYNFAKLTRWPENTWPRADAPLVLCTAGDDALVGALEWLGGKTVKGRAVSIQPLMVKQGMQNCHVLYIAASEQEDYPVIVQSVQGKPVLTISEIRGFAHSKGIIELFREDDRIRFKINLDIARGTGLELSSRLLSLAVVIASEDDL